MATKTSKKDFYKDVEEMFVDIEKKSRTRNQNKKAESTKNENGSNKSPNLEILRKRKRKENNKETSEEVVIEEKNHTEEHDENINNVESHCQSIENQEHQIFIKGNNSDITKTNQIKIRDEIWKAVGREITIFKSGTSLTIKSLTLSEKLQLQSVKYLVNQDVTISDPFKQKSISDQSYKGIIFGVNQEIMEDEIIWETHAKKAQRIVKFIGGKNIQTLQIILTFEDELPSHVFIGWQRYRVDKYIPDPIRCFRCQRYGHVQSQCKSTKDVCAICAQNHKAKECPEKIKQYKERKTNCANCNGQHPANYMGCRKYELAKETTKIQFSETKIISYAQAAMKLKEIRSKETNQDNQNNRIRDQSNQEIEKKSNKIQYRNDDETNSEKTIENGENSPNGKTKGKANEIHEDCHCHLNCVDKQVFLKFLDECQSSSSKNQSNDETLKKFFSTISRLADIIRGSKSSPTKHIQLEQNDPSFQ